MPSLNRQIKHKKKKDFLFTYNLLPGALHRTDIFNLMVGFLHLKF